VPKPLRMLMFAPSTVNVGMQVDTNGDVKIGNHKELTNDILGSNPITRGYIDEFGDLSQFIRNPESEAYRHSRSDVGITSGFMALGFIPPRYKIPVSLAGGLLTAPAVIHLVHDRFR
jgi:hypothetical protein